MKIKRTKVNCSTDSDGYMFIDELERLVKEEYGDKTEFYSEPSAQGDYTGYDMIQVILPHDIYDVEEDYIFNFSFKLKEEDSVIQDVGYLDAAKHYFDIIKDEIDKARKYYTDEYDDEYDEYA